MAEEKNRPAQEGEESEDSDILEMEDEKGNLVRFELLDVVPYQDNDYICVVPFREEKERSEDSGEESEVMQIYRVVPDESSDTELYVGLDSQEEVEAVFKVFRERNADLYNFED